MRKPTVLHAALCCGAIVSTGFISTQPQAQSYTADFGIVRTSPLLHDGANTYFSLEPGTVRELEGEDDNQPVMIRTTVLARTHWVQFRASDGWLAVETRVVEEREWIDGELSQVSLNYFALCPQTSNIYCFGEDVDHYEDGVIISHEDSWLAGRGSAQPGLMMPGSFLLGSRYYQELAPGVSMDRAENMSSGVVLQTPAGKFSDCIVVLETTPLEPDEEVLKVYAPGVGLIADGNILLTRLTVP